MSILSKVRSLFGGGGTGVGFDNAVVRGVGFLFNDFSNAGLDERQIVDAVHSNPAFWSCISMISTSIAEVELHVKNDGLPDRSHPILGTFKKPNGFHTQFTFLWLVAAYLLALGRVYIIVTPQKTLLPVSPYQVWEQQDGMLSATVGGMTITGLKLGESIARLIMPDLRQPYTSGTAYGAVLSQEIDIAQAASKHEAGFLRNHARPDMIVNYKGLKGEHLKKIEEAWKSRHQGPSNAGKPSFSNAEDVMIKPMSASFADLGLIDLRKHSQAVTRQTFGIPPELFGQVENSNRATIDAAEYLYKRNVVSPKLRHLLAELTIKVLPLLSDESRLELYTNSIVPEDREHGLAVAKSFPKAVTVNEVRAMSNLPAIKGGDISYEAFASAEPFEIVQEEAIRPRSRTQLRQPRLRLVDGSSMRERMNFNQDIFKELAG